MKYKISCLVVIKLSIMGQWCIVRISLSTFHQRQAIELWIREKTICIHCLEVQWESIVKLFCRQIIEGLWFQTIRNRSLHKVNKQSFSTMIYLLMQTKTAVTASYQHRTTLVIAVLKIKAVIAQKLLIPFWQRKN